MWQLLSWDVCFLVLVFKRGILFEVLPTVRQNQYKQTTSSRHLTSGILCCFSQLLQSCPPAWAGPGWGGSSPVQPDLIELGLWRENLLWMFLLIRNQLVGRHKGRAEWWEQNIWHNSTNFTFERVCQARPAQQPLFIFIHHPSFHRSSTNNLHNKTFKSRAVEVKNEPSSLCM